MPVLNRVLGYALVGGTAAAVLFSMPLQGPWISLSPVNPIAGFRSGGCCRSEPISTAAAQRPLAESNPASIAASLQKLRVSSKSVTA